MRMSDWGQIGETIRIQRGDQFYSINLEYQELRFDPRKEFDSKNSIILRQNF